MIMKRFIDHLIRSDAVVMESARLACGVPRPYGFTVAAGILPAVEPGILPGGNGVLSGNALPIWRPRPGGKMPPPTAAKMADATHLLPTANTLPRPRGTQEAVSMVGRSVTKLSLSPTSE